MRFWTVLCLLLQPDNSAHAEAFLLLVAHRRTFDSSDAAGPALLTDNGDRVGEADEETISSAVAPSPLDTAEDLEDTELDDFSSEDLSPDGAIAQRIRAELAALEPLAEACFVVAPSRQGVGLGLFVASGTPNIEASTYLFDYTGEELSAEQYHARYEGAGRRADYAVGIETADNSAVYIDGADPDLSNIARYMNHDGLQPNVRASTVFAPQPRLMLFALQDLVAGDELVWDYGESYWKGRDDLQ
jgi:hypothetical protein